jgi:nucleoside-diphosphate-sugar epimerase
MASQYSRALVTGGVGFIGSHIADRLIENNFEVRIIDDLSSGQMEHLRTFKNKKSVLFMKGDIRDPEIVKTAVKDADVVFHEAAIVGPAQSIENPLLTNDVNVNGTLRLLEASVKYGVKRFILASSAAIYGEQSSPNQGNSNSSTKFTLCNF